MTGQLTRRHALGAALAATAISRTARAQGQSMGNGGTIRLMINPAGTMSFPPFVIRKFGLDRKYGFNMVVLPYTSNAAAQSALQGRNADVVVLDWLISARLTQGGVPLTGIAPFLTYVNSVLVPKDSPIRNLGDLAGKRVGSPGRTGFDWAIMVAAARRLYNLDLEKQATVQEAAPPLLRGSITSGQLDATGMWNSLVPDMLVSGRFRTLVTIRELTEQFGIPTAPFLYFGMRTDYERENPQNAAAFAACYREVADILMTNDEVWAERGKEMNLAPEALVLFRDQVRRDLLKTFAPQMNEALVKTFDIVKDVMGTEALGFSSMPSDLLSLKYQ